MIVITMLLFIKHITKQLLKKTAENDDDEKNMKEHKNNIKDQRPQHNNKQRIFLKKNTKHDESFKRY